IGCAAVLRRFGPPFGRISTFDGASTMNVPRLASPLLATLLFAALAASAQTPPAQKVDPTPPPPPDFLTGDPDLEPQVTIIRRDTEVVEEVRVKGELRYI